MYIKSDYDKCHCMNTMEITYAEYDEKLKEKKQY